MFQPTGLVSTTKNYLLFYNRNKFLQCKLHRARFWGTGGACFFGQLRKWKILFCLAKLHSYFIETKRGQGPSGERYTAPNSSQRWTLKLISLSALKTKLHKNLKHPKKSERSLFLLYTTLQTLNTFQTLPITVGYLNRNILKNSEESDHEASQAWKWLLNLRSLAGGRGKWVKPQSTKKKAKEIKVNRRRKHLAEEKKDNLTSTMHGPSSKGGKKKIQNFLQPTLVSQNMKWASYRMQTELNKPEKCNFLKT